MDTHNEFVIESAILYKDKTYTGRRHCDIIALIIQETGVYSVRGEEQGFVTSSGRFVSRNEAAEIAFRNGQIKSSKGRLFSEDLY